MLSSSGNTSAVLTLRNPSSVLKKVKLDWARVKWSRNTEQLRSSVRDAMMQDEHRHEAEDQQSSTVQYTSRKLECPRCGKLKETVGMQLRTLHGYRDVHCGGCGLHAR